MQRISPADSPLLILPDLDALARETRFVIRESFKMDPSTFLQTLCGAVASGFASHNQIAMGLSQRTGAAISSQAIHGRFTQSGEYILNICLNAIHAGSRDPDPAKWKVTEKLLLREIRRTKSAKEKHGGKGRSRRRIGLLVGIPFSNLSFTAAAGPGLEGVQRSGLCSASASW